ncbi:MAG: hypothetical protein J5556_07405, partial [Deltaproteobacteria bacterium]|nr:hypothetical protein [Deltaproteobacteria bacterium]
MKELALMLEEAPSSARIQKALECLAGAFSCAQGALFLLLPDSTMAHVPASVGVEPSRRETIRLSRMLTDILQSGEVHVLAGKKLGSDGALLADAAYELHVLPLRRNDEHVGALFLAAERGKSLSAEPLKAAAALLAAVADTQRPQAGGAVPGGSRPYGFVGGSP